MMSYENLKIMISMFVNSEVKTRSEPYRRAVAKFLRDVADDVDPDTQKEPTDAQAD